MRNIVLSFVEGFEKKLIVIKRDGSQENFDPHKLERVLRAAWVPNSQVKTLTEMIEKKVRELRKQKVHSSEIRDVVLQELKRANPQAYNFYRWYEKLKYV